jgi:hypothetical protein
MLKSYQTLSTGQSSFSFQHLSPTREAAQNKETSFNYNSKH